MIKITPSQMPYLAKCPCYKSAPFKPSAAALRGTALDTLFRNWIQKPNSTFASLTKSASVAKLSKDDTDAVKWAIDNVRALSAEQKVITDKSSCRIQITRHVRSTEVLLSGEIDGLGAICGSIFDLKSGKIRDYKPQIAPYALWSLNTYKRAECLGTLVFCDQRKLITAIYTKQETENFIDNILDSVLDPNKKAIKNEYCAYCTHNVNGTCKIANSR